MIWAPKSPWMGTGWGHFRGHILSIPTYQAGRAFLTSDERKNSSKGWEVRGFPGFLQARVFRWSHSLQGTWARLPDEGISRGPQDPSILTFQPSGKPERHPCGPDAPLFFPTCISRSTHRAEIQGGARLQLPLSAPPPVRSRPFPGQPKAAALPSAARAGGRGGLRLCPAGKSATRSGPH